MKITPIEIRQKSFERVFRGYEKESVDAFLLSLSQEWERIMEENKDLRKKLELSDKEVIRLRDVENSLFRTLKTAEDAGSHILDSATKTAELHVREAQMNAEAILNEARNRARSLLEEAEENAKEVTGNLKEEIKSIERNYILLLDQKDTLLLDIEHMLEEFQDKIHKYAENYNTKDSENKFRNAKRVSLQKLKETFSAPPREEHTRVEQKGNKEAKGSLEPKAEQETNNKNSYIQPEPKIEETKVIITPAPMDSVKEVNPEKSFFDEI